VVIILGYKFFANISDEPDKDNFRFLIKLSNYVSHDLIGKNITVEYVNLIDRKEAAKRFVLANRKYFLWHIKPIYNLLFDDRALESFEEEVSLYIDFKIPYFYYLKKNNISPQDGFKYYKGISNISEDIQYHYDKSKAIDEVVYFNKDANGNIFIGATDKQINYLKSLLKQHGYKLKVDYNKLRMEDAKVLLAFFIDDVDLEENFYNNYLEYS